MIINPYIFPQQVEFVNAGTAVDSGSGTTTNINNVPFPSSLVRGNFLILICTERTNTNFANQPFGWSVLTAPSTTNQSVQVFYKFVDGTEATFNVIYNSSSSNVKVARIFQFRNAIAFQSVGTSNGAVHANHASLTSTADYSLAVSIIFSSTNGVSIGAYSGATGGTWTEPVAEYSTALGNGSTLGINIANMFSPTTISGGDQIVVSNLTADFVLNP